MENSNIKGRTLNGISGNDLSSICSSDNDNQAASKVDENIVTHHPNFIEDESVKLDTVNPIPKVRKIAIFAGLQVALLVSAMDRIIVSTALPQITAEFQTGYASAWVATSYILAITTFIPICTKVSDIFGRKVIILSGVVTIMLGSLVGGLAQSMTMLIIGRVIQGIGAAGNISMVHVIISDIVPLRQRGLYQSFIDMVYAVSYIASPLLGGAFTEYITWRWIFYINLPLGVISLITLGLSLRLPTRKREKFTSKIKRIDFGGSLLVLLSVIAFLLAMNLGGQLYPWKSVIVILLLVLSGIFLLMLLSFEAKVAKEPLFPPRLLLNRSLVGSYCANMMFGIVFNAVLYFLPVYFQVVKNDETMWSGIRILPMLAVVPVVSTATGFFISRFGVYRHLITFSMALLVVGIGLISTFDQNTSWLRIYSSMVVLGVGIAPIFSSMLISVQAAVVSSDIAVATGVSFLIFDIGAAVGMAIAFAMLNNSLSTRLKDTIQADYILYIIQNPVSIRSALPPQYLQPALDAYVRSLQSIWHVWISMPAFGLMASLLIKHFPLRKNLENHIEENK